jgi:hypothetical protein
MLFKLRTILSLAVTGILAPMAASIPSNGHDLSMLSSHNFYQAQMSWQLFLSVTKYKVKPCQHVYASLRVEGVRERRLFSSGSTYHLTAAGT